METNIIILCVCVLIVFACFNGVIVRWQITDGSSLPLPDAFEEKVRQANIKRWLKLWHRLGLGLRVAIWLIIFFESDRNYILTGGIMFADCVTFPVLINLINNLPFYFVGTTADTDILIRKMFPKIYKNV
jgi:hypothetical protein